MRPLPLLLLLLARPALATDPSPAPAAPPADALPAASVPVPGPAPETGPTPAPSAAVADAVPAAPPPTAEAPPPRFGFRLGLGAPDGVTADLVYRPLPYLRLQAGPAWNYLAFGLQGGIALTPIRWAISPVLELRYGHFFGADLGKVFKNAPSELQPLLGDVGYDYFNGQVAMEIGSPSGFSFSLGLGLSYFWSDLHGTATTDRNAGTPDAATVTVTNPRLRAVIPSVRLGLLLYF